MDSSYISLINANSICLSSSLLYNYLLSSFTARLVHFASWLCAANVVGTCDTMTPGTSSERKYIALQTCQASSLVPSSTLYLLIFTSFLSRYTRFYLKAFIYQLVSFVYIIKSQLINNEIRSFFMYIFVVMPRASLFSSQQFGIFSFCRQSSRQGWRASKSSNEQSLNACLLLDVKSFENATWKVHFKKAFKT